MSNFKYMSGHWEFILEQELYVLGMIFNGLPEIQTSTLKKLLENKVLLEELFNYLTLSEQAWLDRRTYRYIGPGCQQQESDRVDFAPIMELINSLLEKLSPTLNVGQVVGEDRLKLIESLNDQAELSASPLILGFFIAPMNFPGIREDWLLMGLVAQLLCVFAQQTGKGAFITHGIDRTVLPASLSTLEYIIAFG
ncbi:hypothetical protein D3C76_470060 [compost metagenome]|uniref:hypothetical protein n=1 Tax=Pseudomonas sp. ACN8 TaxID=1920428 RepID=UPI000BB31158|nr:hypothetical protein [Pseudomonas sp. ACN8]PBJ19311.1 hypothetical protein BSF44_46850 [Pseudomonas sp. ACN8]